MNGFWAWWQHLPGRMDPILLEFGSFRVGWYGMMYVVGFMVVYALASFRLRSEDFPYENEFVQDFLVWSAFGLLIGARLGYVVIYNPGYYLRHPLEIILPISFSGGGIRYTGISGMSFHGGALGVFIATAWLMRRSGVSFVRFSDFIVPCMPLGYSFGRIGNFINGELYGRATTVRWGMYFPSDPSGSLRHPSQLYESFGEGVVLFVLLWLLRRREGLRGLLLAVYLMGYAVARFVVEFFRQPDAQIGFLVGHMSMGQLLSIAMAMFAVVVGVFMHRHRDAPFVSGGPGGS